MALPANRGSGRGDKTRRRTRGRWHGTGARVSCWGGTRGQSSSISTGSRPQGRSAAPRNRAQLGLRASPTGTHEEAGDPVGSKAQSTGATGMPAAPQVCSVPPRCARCPTGVPAAPRCARSPQVCLLPPGVLAPPQVCPLPPCVPAPPRCPCSPSTVSLPPLLLPDVLCQPPGFGSHRRPHGLSPQLHCWSPRRGCPSAGLCLTAFTWIVCNLMSSRLKPLNCVPSQCPSPNGGPGHHGGRAANGAPWSRGPGPASCREGRAGRPKASVHAADVLGPFQSECHCERATVPSPTWRTFPSLGEAVSHETELGRVT